MTGRGLLVVVALLVVTSGCVGLGGGGDAPAATPSASASGGSGGSGGSSGSGSGSPGGSSGGGSDGGRGGDPVAGFQPVDDFDDVQTEAQMADYIDRSPFPVFRPGEYFVYEGTNGFQSEDDTGIPVRMEIQSVEGGEWLDADLEVTLTRGEETETYSSADGSIGRILLSPELALTQNGRGWIWLYRYNVVTNVDPRISELSVGDTWRYESPDRESDEPPSGFTFEVTEQRQYAGQSCFVVDTYRFEGEESTLFSNTCVATDVGMPLYYVVYQDDGEVLLEMELVEYRR